MSAGDQRQAGDLSTARRYLGYKDDLRMTSEYPVFARASAICKTFIVAPRCVCLLAALLMINSGMAATLQFQFLEGQCRGDTILDSPVPKLSAIVTLTGVRDDSASQLPKTEVIRASPTDKEGRTSIVLPDGASTHGAVSVT